MLNVAASPAGSSFPATWIGRSVDRPKARLRDRCSRHPGQDGAAPADDAEYPREPGQHCLRGNQVFGEDQRDPIGKLLRENA